MAKAQAQAYNGLGLNSYDGLTPANEAVSYKTVRPEHKSHWVRNTLLALGVAGAIATTGIHGYKSGFFNNPFNSKEQVADSGVRMPTKDFTPEDFASAINESYVRLGRQPVQPSQMYAFKKLPHSELEKIAKHQRFPSVKAFMKNRGYVGEGLMATFTYDEERPSPDGIFGYGYYVFFKTKDGKLIEEGRLLSYQ